MCCGRSSGKSKRKSTSRVIKKKPVPNEPKPKTKEEKNDKV